MSAAWLKLITILCLFSTALSGSESGGVVWRHPGEFITIQCKCNTSDQEYLSLETGLNQDQIFYKERGSVKNTTAERFRDRLQLNGIFPNLEILIKNLTTEDTGPYWCFYKKYDHTTSQVKTKKGEGSVLLVVTDQELRPGIVRPSESGGVVWRHPGEFITIQCKCNTSDQEYLSLETGLNQEQIFYKGRGSVKNTIAERFRDRLQLNGIFPNLEILIKNLTTEDTGPYWCFYKKYDHTTSQVKTKKGEGSVLLVVTDQELRPGIVRPSEKSCDPSDKNLVLLSVVISAAILLGIIIGFLIWIVLKTKALRSTHSTRSTEKPRRATTNDVYEDMRGTMRH